MEISIDEIKLILNNQFSIRDALKTKKSLLKNSDQNLTRLFDYFRETIHLINNDLYNKYYR